MLSIPHASKVDPQSTSYTSINLAGIWSEHNVYTYIYHTKFEPEIITAESHLDEGHYQDWVERIAEDEISMGLRDSVVSSLKEKHLSGSTLRMQSQFSNDSQSGESGDARVAHAALQLLEENLNQA